MTSAYRVLIADEMHGSIVSLLKEAGFDPVYFPMISREDILKIIKEFDGLVIRSKTDVDKELINAATSLKFVARAGAGIDKLDVEYLAQKKIQVINAPEGNRDALGEHALGMLLSILHRLSIAHRQVGFDIWDREGNRGIELKGKVVGVYGMGNMGMSFAKKLSGLDCEVIGFDKYKENLSMDYIDQVSLEEFKKRTEILSIHVPLQEDTRQLFTRSYLEEFENLKILMNTSRGEVLNAKGLVDLLENGQLVGAGLDVLENEKLTTYSEEEKIILDRLLDHPNVLITPHVGGWTYESYERINEVIVEKLKTSFPR